MSKKAFIFDLDGTLLRTYEDIANAVNFGLRKNGLPERTAENFKIYTGNGTDVMILRALPEESRNEETLAAVRPFYFEYYNEHSGEKTRPYAGVTDALSELKKKGIKLAVTSNKVDFMARKVVKDYFGDTFDFVTGQREGVPQKPDPAMILEAVNALGVTADEAVLVGDTPVDVETGKNSGVFVVGVSWGFRGEKVLRESGADAVISEPHELIEYI